MIRRLLLILLTLLVAAPATAVAVQSPEVARLQAQYRDAVVRLRRLEAEARAAARAAVSEPRAASAVGSDRSALDALAAREAPLIGRLAGVRSSQTRLLSGLIRLSRLPAPVLFMTPEETLAARRAGLLMQETAYALDREAGRIQAERRALAAERRARVLDQASALEAESRAGERGAEAADRRADAATRAAVLEAEARTARAEVEALAAQLRRLGAPVPEVPADARSRVAALPAGMTRLTPPVEGPPGARFGRDAAGWRWPGAGQTVIAPAPGRVAYAGPHEAWDQVVLLDLGEGWTAVLAGLDQVAVRTGGRVKAGARMGVARSGEPFQFELRREERPVDPGPFLR